MDIFNATAGTVWAKKRGIRRFDLEKISFSQTSTDGFN